jgi:K+-transporting ATPase KdpF subunit
MKNNILNSLGVFITVPADINVAANNSISYLIGGIIALLIMGYLVYTLLKPEKF